ncbi:MAG TPA: fibronectin type III domain-containing protein [Patescibacteria group bacterium]|nr:fibronectin type III domain-containing protein [Patescibacteria group bacterium]
MQVSWNKGMRTLIASILLAGFIFFPLSSSADVLSARSDRLSRALVSVGANHTITFTTQTSVSSPSATITLAFASSSYSAGFNLSSLTSSDFSLTFGPSGTETATVIASVPAPGVWGAGISGQVITLTPPTDTGLNLIPAGNIVIIKIGTNAGGTHQIINPSLADTYTLSIAGAFGDSGGIAIPIVSSNAQISVSATFSGSVVIPPVPKETTPPQQSGISAINVTTSSASIVWTTDELGDSLVEYGTTNAYGASVSNGNLVLSHALDLTGLLPNTVYHFRVSSRDSNANLATSNDQTFQTLSVAQAPVISNIRTSNISDTSAVVLWDTDISATGRIDYGTTSQYGQVLSAGALTQSHQFILTGLRPNTVYHFAVTSAGGTGLSSVSSDQLVQTLPDQTPPTNPSDFSAIPDDSRITLSWTNPLDPDFANVVIVANTEHFPASMTDGRVVYQGSATSTIDTGLQNGTHYRYTIFALDTTRNVSSGAYADATPQASTVVLPPPATTTPPEVLPPPGPTGQEEKKETTTSTLEAPTSTPEVPFISIQPLFYAAAGAVYLPPDPNGRIGAGMNQAILVQVPAAALGTTIDSGSIRVGSSTYALALSPNGDLWSASFLSESRPGEWPISVQVKFSDGRNGKADLTLLVQAYGRVMESVLIGAPEKILSGATVTLYENQNGQQALWDGTRSLQPNPVSIGDNGVYGFTVPNGSYSLVVSKDGYKTATKDVPVLHNWLSVDVTLDLLPKKIEEIISPQKSISENIQSIAEEAKPLIQATISAVQSKEAQVVAKSVLIPTALSFAVANTATAASIFHLFNYLQFLATQPVLLFGRRRRKQWGLVYNSLTKQPIDLAVVRLIFADKNLLVQTRITDAKGRFSFLVRPGKYRVEVVKPGFVFPTQYLRNAKTDIDFVDLYHGEIVDVTKSATLAFNVPVDPIAFEETPRKILFKKSLRRIQNLMGWLSVVVTLGALIISPSWIVFGLLVIQIGMHVVFRRLSLPPKPKNWGFVYDKKSRSAIDRVVVRIFDKKFNKLLETQVTDKDGKYGFFVGKNVYYVTAEKAGYGRYVSPDIDLSNKEESVIDQNIALEQAAV